MGCDFAKFECEPERDGKSYNGETITMGRGGLERRYNFMIIERREELSASNLPAARTYARKQGSRKNQRVSVDGVPDTMAMGVVRLGLAQHNYVKNGMCWRTTERLASCEVTLGSVLVVVADQPATR